MQQRDSQGQCRSRWVDLAGMEEVAVNTPQYFLQGNQLFGGRVAGSLFDLAECAGADGDALQLQLCH